MTIKAIIWDFGGVFTSSPFDGFRAFEQARGLPRDFLRGVNATNPHENAWAQFERAEIGAEAFDSAFAEESAALGYRVRGAEVLSLLCCDIRPAMVAALKACKGRYKLGCITNNVPSGFAPGMSDDAEVAAAIADIFAQFDHVTESSKVGLRKPEPRIYQLMCDALQIAPRSCVYLDDLGVNCKQAAALGMIAIKVQTGEQALADLSRTLGHELGRTTITA
ncbi:HAD-IA family hydrolase [Rhodopseudomonas palustris]|uniref:Epoxide hydrolase-like phosphatase n=1 Tax=Rhodopseudomonas palustris (strain BisB18) TaxID=316056 RepID=Q21BL8_RHOPB